MATLAHPLDNEVFELTLDSDAPENQPQEMIRRGCDKPELWKHTGPTVTGKQTRYFKLVSVGCQPNFAAVVAALAAHGTIPAGQWRGAVAERFPYDGAHFIGIADASWVNPNGAAFFPSVYVGLFTHVGFADKEFGDHCLWIVEVSKPA